MQLSILFVWLLSLQLGVAEEWQLLGPLATRATPGLCGPENLWKPSRVQLLALSPLGHNLPSTIQTQHMYNSCTPLTLLNLLISHPTVSLRFLILLFISMNHLLIDLVCISLFCHDHAAWFVTILKNIMLYIKNTFTRWKESTFT